MSETPFADSNTPNVTGAPSSGGPTWLLAPAELPPGVQLSLTAVVEATDLKPEVMQALVHVAQEVQRSASTPKPQARCSALVSCGDFTGDECNRLRSCGHFHSGPSPL
jgi:hypothetical protein